MTLTDIINLLITDDRTVQGDWIDTHNNNIVSKEDIVNVLKEVNEKLEWYERRK